MKYYLLKAILLIIPIVLLNSCDFRGSSEKVRVADDSPEEINRFFNDDSFWNQPIPRDAEIDPLSDYWIGLLDKDPSGENIGLNVGSFTLPIYELNSKEIADIEKIVNGFCNFFKLNIEKTNF